MAMNKCVVAAASAMMMLIQVAVAANYTVGGTTGSWDSTTDLKTWSSSQKFQVGDNLVFQYDGIHNLMEVSKSDYDSCQASNAVQSYSDGNTVISLTSPGKRYFICGMPGHCLQGMKVEIDTLASAPASSAPTPTGGASQAPAVSKLPSSPSPLTSPTLSPVASTTPLPSDVPSSSAESPVPVTTTKSTTVPPQPSPSASSGTRGSFSTSLAFGFILIAVLVLMQFN